MNENCFYRGDATIAPLSHLSPSFLPVEEESLQGNTPLPPYTHSSQPCNTPLRSPFPSATLPTLTPALHYPAPLKLTPEIYHLLLFSRHIFYPPEFIHSSSWPLSRSLQPGSSDLCFFDDSLTVEHSFTLQLRWPFSVNLWSSGNWTRLNESTLSCS